MERQVGEAAGKVWQTLSKSPVPLGQLPKATKLPVDLANQALGWLAREGKIAVAQDTLKGKVLKLKG